MKKLLALSLSLLLIFFSSLPVQCVEHTDGRARPEEPSVSAHSAILIDADSGRVLLQKNPDERMGMASTTKIMTAMVALRLCDKDTVISVPREAVGVEGSSVYLVEGERLTLLELLYALLLSSANDAAVAIAVSLSGSVERFAEEMNLYAEELGLTDTHFSNPHGLYDEDHYTTARELGIIAAEALRSDIIRDIVAKKKITIPHDGVKDKRLLVNHNKMLSYYEGAIGMKTGFTKKTGRCLVSAATRDGLTLIAITLNAPNDWRDHTALFDFGFENFERRVFYTAGSFSYALPLCDSKSESVMLTNTEPLCLTVRKGAEITSVTVEAPFRFAIGSVRRGSFFGQVTISADGVAARSPLAFSQSSTGSTKPKVGFFERIYNFFLPEV